MDETIKHIIPAPKGMIATYFPKKDGRSDGEPWEEPIVCLAIINGEDGDRIVAITPNDCDWNWDGTFSVLSGDQNMRIAVGFKEDNG